MRMAMGIGWVAPLFLALSLAGCASVDGTDGTSAAQQEVLEETSLNGEALAQRRTDLTRAWRDLVHLDETMQTLTDRGDSPSIVLLDNFIAEYMSKHLDPLLRPNPTCRRSETGTGTAADVGASPRFAAPPTPSPGETGRGASRPGRRLRGDRKRARAVAGGVFDVVPPGVVDPRAHGVVHRADDAARHADDHGGGRDDHALLDQGPGADDRAGADHGAVEDDGAHADEAVVLDGRAVHDGVVTDGNTFPHGDREAGG